MASNSNNGIIYVEGNDIDNAKVVLDKAGIKYKEDESLLYATIRQDITNRISEAAEFQSIVIDPDKSIIDVIVERIINTDAAWYSYDEVLNEESSIVVMEKLEERDNLNDEEDDY